MGMAMTHEDYPRKVKNGFIQVADLRDQLQKDITQCEHDLVRVNEQNELSFLYSQLLKEILVENTAESAIFVKIYALFGRTNYRGNVQELSMIEEFERTYGKGKHSSPIWWYTRRCFVSRTINRAIHLLDVEILCIVHFFIRDLHNQLAKIHAEKSKYESPLIVYRGQGMQPDDFKRLLKKNETCIVFNNFIFTTTDRQEAFCSAQNAFNKGLIGILFEMHVDPSLEGISPFARIEVTSYGKKSKNQILFSMHSVFRIETVERSDNGIWNIKLKLSNMLSNQLIDKIREQIQGRDVLWRMGALFFCMAEFDKSRQIYLAKLPTISKDDFRAQAHFHNRLAFIFKQMNETTLSQHHYNEYIHLKKKYGLTDEVECAYIQAMDRSEMAKVKTSPASSQQQLDELTLKMETAKSSQNDPASTFTIDSLAEEKVCTSEQTVTTTANPEKLRLLTVERNTEDCSTFGASASEAKSEMVNKKKKPKKKNRHSLNTQYVKGAKDKSDDEMSHIPQPPCRSTDDGNKRFEREFWNSEFGRTNQTQRQARNFFEQSAERDQIRCMDLTQQLRKKPRVIVEVGGEGCGRLSASTNSILFSPTDVTIFRSSLPSHKLYHIDKNGTKTQVELNNERKIGIQAICWSSYLGKFIVLTADKIKKLYTFDEEKMTTTNYSQHIEHIPDSKDREYESCTCSDQIFLVTYKGFNPIIDQWQLSDWKRTKLWGPPISCGNLEMIHHIRFSQNNSLHIGLIIDQFRTYRFESRNYLTMECLKTVDFNESNQINTPVPVSLSTGEWLFTATVMSFISKNVIGRMPIEYGDDNVENAIQLNQNCLIIKTKDGKLKFHDYHD
ncbi:unnamed protein product [Adineta steineri]|uniref:Uncharacterized protein n=1 Tax=Adineta steineri TaxID=433720 RepID=A0A814BDP3_9BILA|nr:unnamed protein product [Adineta steineri]CAF1507964.1 unnamed protein product [Adineta steineri]